MVDVVVIERRVMTAVWDDANAAHIQQPTLGPINRKGESLSRKFSGDDLRRAQSNTTDAHRVKRVGVRRDSRRPAPGRAGARDVIRFATRPATTAMRVAETLQFTDRAAALRTCPRARCDIRSGRPRRDARLPLRTNPPSPRVDGFASRAPRPPRRPHRLPPQPQSWSLVSAPS